jgi:hypothetical protein
LLALALTIVSCGSIVSSIVTVRGVLLLLKTAIEKLKSWPIAAMETEATLSAASGGSFGLIVGVLVAVAPPGVLVGVTGVLVAVAPPGVLVGVTGVLVGVTGVLVAVAPPGVLVGVTGVLVAVAPPGVLVAGGGCDPGGLVRVTRCSNGAAGTTVG